MVRATASLDPRFGVDTLELDRPGPSYTIDTVRELKRRMPDAELWLIVGADQVRAFDSWREPAAIVEEVRLAIFDREGSSAQAAASALPKGARSVVVPVPRVDASSTAVRARVRAGQDVSALLPPAVRRIVERERLYSSP